MFETNTKLFEKPTEKKVLQKQTEGKSLRISKDQSYDKHTLHNEDQIDKLFYINTFDIKKLKVNAEKRERMPELISILILKFPSLVLAGGAVRGVLFDKPINDFDFFLLHSKDNPRHKVIEELRELLKALGADEIFVCPEGFLYSYKLKISEDKTLKIQFINRDSYSTIEQILNRFDYTVCAFAYNKGKYYALEPAIKDTFMKSPQLMYVGYPVSAMNRLYKYRKKGFDMRAVIISITKSLVNIGKVAPELELDDIGNRFVFYID